MSFWLLVTICVHTLRMHTVLAASTLARDVNPSTTNISATIKDQLGHDVTKNFTTMIYRAPLENNKTSNLNDRQVTYVRPIAECGEMEGIFVDSTCNHGNMVLGSLQAYTYRCLLYVPHPRNPRYTHRTILSFPGQCRDDEICVNGLGRNQLRENENVEMAHCVQSEAYTRLAGSYGARVTDEHVKNATVDVALSGSDQKTSMKADSISTHSGTSALGGAKGSAQSKSCFDCLDLTTDPLSPNTDFIDTEVRLLATGLTMGILWLTILSG